MTTAEIISTGNELIQGSIVDTNGAWLLSRLADAGIQAGRSSLVGDDKDEIASLIKEAASRNRAVIVTGGLGPTSDDLTARAAADASEDTLRINSEALGRIRSFFEKRQMTMSASNEKQAFLPSRAAVIDNSCGTAPGFCLEIGHCSVYFLPGVPSEMRYMFEEHVLPDICRRCDLEERLSCTLTLFGLPEATAGEMLKQADRKFPAVNLGFRAAFPEIQVKISVAEKERTAFHQAREWVISQLAPKLISESGLSMPEVVAELLSRHGLTVALAESCTGGLISNLLTDVPGSSAYFLSSAVTYANRAKTDMLNVQAATIAEYGAVHEKTALEMAAGIRNAAGADFGLSTTGIAGPSGGSDEKPVGTVCIGIASKRLSDARRYRLNFSDRRKNKQVFAHTALNMLRKALQTY